MLYVAGLLACIAGVMFIFGIKEIFKRDVHAHRFSAFRYVPEEDQDLRSLKKDTPKSKKKENPLILILFLILSVSLFYMIAGFTGIIVGVVVGFLAPKVLSRHKRKSGLKILSAQVEQAAETMSIVLRSGGGIPDALEKAVQNTKNPLKKEIDQALSEIKLGLPEADVFQRLSERLDVPEIDMLGIASSLQKEGMAVNMANVLRQIQINIRARQAFYEEVSAITAENKLAVWVISCVPFVTIIFMRLFAPDFMAPLFSTSLGTLILTICFCVVIVGIIWAMKIAEGGTTL